MGGHVERRPDQGRPAGRRSAGRSRRRPRTHDLRGADEHATGRSWSARTRPRPRRAWWTSSTSRPASRRELAGPEPASGGSWALTGGDLYYPTYGDDRAYCLATNALADSNGEDGWCAPKGSGFSGLTASDLGVGMMTFDDARPVACRTVNLLDGSGVPQPVDGPTDCLAWDVAPRLRRLRLVGGAQAAAPGGGPLLRLGLRRLPRPRSRAPPAACAALRRLGLLRPRPAVAATSPHG